MKGTTERTSYDLKGSELRPDAKVTPPPADGKVPRVLREGIIAGIIGATAVAIWFFAIDAFAGRAFYTPSVLGRAFLTILDADLARASTVVHVLAYTAFHYVAFAFAGVVASAVVNLAERNPTVLAGAFMLFLVFEIGFLGLVALIQQVSVLGVLAWYQVMAGNVIAAALMGIYLWHEHPNLAGELTHALDGTAQHEIPDED
jgi:hypothetical protein